jgi:glycosyltransferase involved in cell wall biosynthesis
VPLLPDSQALTYDAQCKIVLALVKAALSEHRLLQGKFDSPIQWFYSPMPVVNFISQFGAVAVVYDCMDELANFRFAPPEIGERERELIAKADVVFTGGYRLYEAKSLLHKNTHFFGCGVDAAHFGKAALASTSVPLELANLPGPILGYFGVIDERLDYTLIKRLAQSFPNASVVMVGPVAKVDPRTLPHLPNIHWLGQRSYEELPAIVKAFDVCLMPFALNESTQYINPTKTLEYMAAGKPVVSTAVPDVMRNFTPVVQIAHSVDDYLIAVRHALHYPDPKLIATGIESARNSSWDSTVAKMRELMLACIRKPAFAATLSKHLIGGSAPLMATPAGALTFARDARKNETKGITL